jgi:hypothetical protein
MSATKDPATGTVTIVLTEAELDAQYIVHDAYSGSDEWDLNDAFSNGYKAALDDLLHGRVSQPMADLDGDPDPDLD